MVRRGFTAVELLVTLFVLAMFLMSAYALYGFALADSAQTRADARAYSLAREYLDRYTVALPYPCAEFSDAVVDTLEGVGDVQVVIDGTCPNESADNLYLVQVQVSYGANGSVAVVSSYGVGE